MPNQGSDSKMWYANSTTASQSPKTFNFDSNPTSTADSGSVVETLRWVDSFLARQKTALAQWWSYDDDDLLLSRSMGNNCNYWHGFWFWNLTSFFFFFSSPPFHPAPFTPTSMHWILWFTLAIPDTLHTHIPINPARPTTVAVRSEQQLHPSQGFADDSGVCAIRGRPGVAGATLLVAAEPVVQPVRGGFVRANVQSTGPELVLASGLGKEYHLLQGSQGESEKERNNNKKKKIHEVGGGSWMMVTTTNYRSAMLGIM